MFVCFAFIILSLSLFFSYPPRTLRPLQADKRFTFGVGDLTWPGDSISCLN